MSKVMTLDNAVSKFINDGDCIALGGFTTNRRPYAIVREIIRQNKKDLYIEGGGAGGDVDMLIGTGCVKVLNNSYIANSGYTQVCKRFRDAVQNENLLIEDYSLDVQTIAYHGAALGLSYVPVKNMLGSDLEMKWGISEEQRKKLPKLPRKKFIIQSNPFNPSEKLCLIPTPKIDVSIIHVQKASSDGTCRIEGPEFQDVDIAVSAKYTIITCEELVDSEELNRDPDKNSIPGLCIDAVVPLRYAAHPSQCYNYYDYDSSEFIKYDIAGSDIASFENYINNYVFNCKNHEAYLDKIGVNKLLSLEVDKKYGYVPKVKSNIVT